jgi:glutamyl-tRNA synthetase
MNQRKVRVRFAPSPTGPLHIGGVRTALYNYLFARQHGGDFILRIEDTDSNRFVEGAEDYIVKSLEWCGIKFNEGVSVGGPHAPYRQSERKEIYLKYALSLVEKGFAYYAFDTSEELDSLRKAQESQGKAFTYNHEVRSRLKTSINPAFVKEYKKLIENGEQWVIRFKTPVNEEIHMHDLIRGEVIVNSSTLDDKVLFKSADGLPTYHLANIADDYLMEVSHVIRGEEWLPSLPLHVLLYRSLGWENVMPQFAHLPLLLKPDGKGKLSKRDGDKLGFPVFPMHWEDPTSKEISSGYDDYGFIPAAFINFLSLLGWNPGTTQEIFNLDELCQAFSLEKVSKSGAKFDFEKAKWFNQHYIKATADADLAKQFAVLIHEKGITANIDYVTKVCGLVKERLVFLKDFWQQASFFFVAPDSYDAEVIKKRWKDNIPELMVDLNKHLSETTDFGALALKDTLHHFIESKQANMGAVMNCLRLSMVGGSFGPDLPVILEMLGKEEVLKRIDKAVNSIK